MKKCPKCGTILDDSKKKCYMCGANLSLSKSVSEFSASFNDEIGSSVSKGTDNVFNNGKDIDVNSKDIVDAEINNNGSFFSHNSSSRDYFGGEINKLNEGGVKKEGRFAKRKEEKTKEKFFGKLKEEPKSDERIPQEMLESIIEKNTEKIVDKPEEKEVQEEARVIKSNIIMEEKKKEEAIPDAFKTFNSFSDEKTLEDTKELKKSNDFFSLDAKEDKPSKKEVVEEEKNIEESSSKKESNDFFSFADNKDSKTKVDKAKNESKESTFASAFSFYDDKKEDKKVNKKEEPSSSSSQQDFSKMKEKRNVNWGDNVKRKVNRTKTDIKETGRSIFNLTCLAIFIALMVFVYFKWLRVDKYEQLSGIRFRVPATFKLMVSDSESKYYESESLGNECAVRIRVGATEGDSYTESFFRYVKNMYSKEEENAETVHDSMSINGNMWESEKIIFLPKDGSNVTSESIIPRYNYTLMLYNGAFYNINYINLREDKECDTNLKNFMHSVEFIDSNVKDK